MSALPFGPCISTRQHLLAELPVPVGHSGQQSFSQDFAEGVKVTGTPAAPCRSCTSASDRYTYSLDGNARARATSKSAVASLVGSMGDPHTSRPPNPRFAN